MKPRSCKNKGKRFENRLRDDLRLCLKELGMQDGDCEARGMGQPGEDIILSPQARKYYNLYIEAKNVESLSVAKTFSDHFEKYKDKGLVILAHTKNRGIPLATLRWEDLVSLMMVKARHNYNREQGYYD